MSNNLFYIIQHNALKAYCRHYLICINWHCFCGTSSQMCLYATEISFFFLFVFFFYSKTFKFVFLNTSVKKICVYFMDFLDIQKQPTSRFTQIPIATPGKVEIVKKKTPNQVGAWATECCTSVCWPQVAVYLEKCCASLSISKTLKINK